MEKFAVQDMTLGADPSKHIAVAVLKMPKLNTLRVQNVKLDIQFFSVMADMAHKSQVTD